MKSPLILIAALVVPFTLRAQEAPLPQPAKPDETKPTKPAETKLAKPDGTKPEPATPDEPPPVDVVTITGARGERIPLDVERSITVLSEDDVRQRYTPRNLTDLLQRIPGVHGQETGPGQGSPMIRGLTGFHVLTLIDGVRLNTSFFRSGPNQYNGLVDPLLIDRLEVLRGAGSTLYGSDALGGVIALHSRRPVAPKGTAEGAAWGRVGSYFRATLPTREGAEWQLQPRLELQGGVGPVAAIVGFDYQHVGDREGGQHARTLRNTAYSVRNGDLKVIAQLSPQDRLTFAYQGTDVANGPRTHSTLFAESYRGSSVGSDQRRDLDNSRQLAYVQVETKNRGFVDRGKLSVSIQQFREEQKRIRGSGSFNRAGFEVWSFGTFLELETDIPGAPVDTTIVYGVDWYHDELDTYSKTNGLSSPGSRGPLADDSNYDLFGAFLRVEVDLDVVLLTAGVRYTFAHIHASKVDPDPADAFPFGKLDRSYQGLTGSFGAIVPIIQNHLSLVGSVNQGFRAPNLDDTTSFQAVSSNAFDSPSPGVDPEESLTLEVGLKWSWPFLRGQVFYAYTFLTDFIQRIPTGNQISGQDEFTKDNFSDGSIQAVDGEVQLLIDPLLNAINIGDRFGFSLLGRFSWVRGFAENLINGRKAKDHLRRSPPARGAVALRWDHPDQGWVWAEVEGEFIRKQRRLSAGDRGDTQRIPPRGTPSYTLWHLRAGVRLLEERLKVSLGLENLFDRDYRVHGSGTNGYGRRLTFALEVLY